MLSLRCCLKSWRNVPSTENRIVKRLLSSTRRSQQKNVERNSPPDLKAKILDHNAPLMNQKQNFLFGMSFSELAGHTSFVCVTAAFANSDVLVLRTLAMSGVSLSILFQFYRPAPLWIPIRWNFLLLAINGIMVSTLIYERQEARYMPKDWEVVFQRAKFEQRGFSRVEFNKLLKKGRKTCFKEGDLLTRNGKQNTKLYFLTEGNVEIFRNGRKLALVEPYHFIGELAFLNYRSEESASEDMQSTVASADAIVGGCDLIVWEWDFSELKGFLEDEREVSNALDAYINYDLRRKLIRTGISISH